MSIFNNQTVVGWGIRLAAPIIVSKIGKLFEDYIWVYAKKLAKMTHFIEEKSGIDLFPDEFQEKYEIVVNHGVEFVEAVFTNPVKIRFILNRILRNEAKISPEELEKYAGVAWQDFLKQLPADLKEILSAEKENMALDFISDQLERLLKVSAPKTAIRASIQNVVKAKNENAKKVAEAIDEDSFTATWARLTSESKNRQETLK